MKRTIYSKVRTKALALLPLSLFTLLPFLSGCSSDDIDRWDTKGYAWFPDESLNTDFTFRSAPGVGYGESYLVPIPFATATTKEATDRTVNVEVVRQPSDSRTKYELQTPVIFHANHIVDTLWVKVTNSEHLATVHDTISFKIVESNDFLPGFEGKTVANLCLYNGFAKPKWWDEDAEGYLGYFTQLKMEVYYAVFGDDRDPRGEKGTWYSNIAVDYAIYMLSDYVEKNNIRYPDDDPNAPGQAPVFDWRKY